MVKAISLEESAEQAARLRDITDLLPIWVCPGSDSRRTYWILIEQRIRRAVIVGCTNEEVFNAVGISQGLRALF